MEHSKSLFRFGLKPAASRGYRRADRSTWSARRGKYRTPTFLVDRLLINRVLIYLYLVLCISNDKVSLPCDHNHNNSHDSYAARLAWFLASTRYSADAIVSLLFREVETVMRELSKWSIVPFQFTKIFLRSIIKIIKILLR